jgi:CheY-like chemotaxis protein
VSRIVTGRLGMEVRPVDPAGAVEAAVEAVRPAADAKGVRLQAAFESESALVVGDPDRLRQVAWNLLFNAVKFTGDGGSVDVLLARRASHVELTVRDAGEGIDPLFLPYVFDRFRQADSSSRRRHGGVGLGLSLVRHLVEMHGGTVHAESPGLGQGATFTVRLPVTQALPAPAAAPQAPAREVPLLLAGRKVLLVDDEPDGREGLALYLRHRGAAVVCAGSAREALATIERDRPDVIIADIAIPGEDGFRLMERVRALPPDQGGSVPAVAMTGYSRDEDRNAALEAGFDAFTVKPVDPSDLAGLLARLSLRGGEAAAE